MNYDEFIAEPVISMAIKSVRAYGKLDDEAWGIYENMLRVVFIAGQETGLHMSGEIVKGIENKSKGDAT